MSDPARQRQRLETMGALTLVNSTRVARWNGRWVIVNVLWELKPNT